MEVIFAIFIMGLTVICIVAFIVVWVLIFPWSSSVDKSVNDKPNKSTMEEEIKRLKLTHEGNGLYKSVGTGGTITTNGRGEMVEKTKTTIIRWWHWNPLINKFDVVNHKINEEKVPIEAQ
jgi:CBS domain containing-hemolysin-like protein